MVDIEKVTVGEKPARKLNAKYTVEPICEMQAVYDTGCFPKIKRFMSAGRWRRCIFENRRVRAWRKKHNICWGVDDDLVDILSEEIRREIDNEILNSINEINKKS